MHCAERNEDLEAPQHGATSNLIPQTALHRQNTRRASAKVRPLLARAPCARWHGEVGPSSPRRAVAAPAVLETAAENGDDAPAQRARWQYAAGIPQPFAHPPLRPAARARGHPPLRQRDSAGSRRPLRYTVYPETRYCIIAFAENLFSFPNCDFVLLVAGARWSTLGGSTLGGELPRRGTHPGVYELPLRGTGRYPPPWRAWGGPSPEGPCRAGGASDPCDADPK